MHNKQENRTMDYMLEIEQPVSKISKRRKRRKGGFLRKTAAFVLRAAIFGGLAGGSFYGVNALLDNTATAEESQESGAAFLSTVSYTSRSLSHRFWNGSTPL